MLGGVVGLAVVVSIMVSGAISKMKGDKEAEINAIKAINAAKTKVVFAAKDITEGASITSADLEEREITQSKAPEDAIPSASLAINRIAKYGIASGNIVSQRDLAPVGVTPGFQSRLKKGMRAITFGVDANSGVAGFITPEDYVDILAMVGSGAEIKAQPILSDVEVIAVGQTYQKLSAPNAANPASSVTVALTPSDSSKLAKAFTVGKLYLTLRNNDDHTPVATVDITSMFNRPAGASEVIGSLPRIEPLPPPPLSLDLQSQPQANDSVHTAEPPSQPRYHEIEIWSGNRKDTLSVPRE
jgi:pilus assembly protein CpaB